MADRTGRLEGDMRIEDGGWRIGREGGKGRYTAKKELGLREE